MIWLVTPCWRRPAITRLAFLQRAQLETELAASGVTCRTVVIADDENLDLAAEFGFDALERPNVLGLRVNDGFEYAAREGASHVCFIGSDDWLHVDFFADVDGLRRDQVLAGHHIAIVDMETGFLRRLGVRGPQGVSPWLISVGLLAKSGYRPVPEDATRGMEGHLHRALLDAEWVFHDPHDLTRVDFKSAVNMTPYQRVNRLLGYGDEEVAWPVLAERYPTRLVNAAFETFDAIRNEWAGAVAA